MKRLRQRELRDERLRDRCSRKEADGNSSFAGIKPVLGRKWLRARTASAGDVDWNHQMTRHFRFPLTFSAVPRIGWFFATVIDTNRDDLEIAILDRRVQKFDPAELLRDVHDVVGSYR